MVERWRALARLLVLVFALVELCAASPRHGWTVRLLDPGIPGTAAISQRFALPPGLAVHEFEALRFELDGDTVTPSVSEVGRTFAYRPPEPLPSGPHLLRIVYAPNQGRWRELGVWHFVVSEPIGADEPTPPSLPGRTSARLGTFGRLELEVTDDRPAGPGQRDDPMRRLLATLHAGHLRASLGPQKLSYSSLIHRDRERSVAVAEWQLGEQGQIRGFGMRSQADGDSPQPAGANGAGDRLNGLLLQKAFKAGGDNHLGLATAWISGRARTADQGWLEGDAWSIAGEASALSERLRLHAEYAGSRSDRYDHPAGDSTMHADAGDAFKAVAEVRAPQSSRTAWYIATGFSEVARGFASPGNPKLAADRRELHANAGARLGDWELDLSFDRRRDSPILDPSRPTEVADTWKLSTRRPSVTDLAAGSPGVRSYRFTAKYSQRRPTSTVGVADGQPTVRASDDLVLEGELEASDWQLGLRASGSFGSRPVDTASDDAASLGFDVYGGLSGGLPIPIEPGLSWRRHQAIDDGSTSDTWRATVKTQPVALRRDLEADFDLALQHVGPTDDRSSSFSAGLQMGLHWTLQRPTASHQGLGLAVTGNVSSSAVGDDGAGDAGYGLMISLTSENPRRRR